MQRKKNNMLSIVIPVFNAQEMTDECIDNLQQHATGDLDIIVVDNGSPVPYKRDGIRIIYNEENKGFWPSLQQGIAEAYSDIVMTLHNDVLIWEHNFDIRILSHFSKDHLLAIAGLFGASGVGIDGGRGNPESNMLGKKYGTSGTLHGALLTGSHPAVVFDSLCMIFRKRHLELLDPDSLPMHHWCDRLVTLRAVLKGLHCLTIGIAFDHGGGYTSTKVGTKNNAMEDFCKKNNIPFTESWDLSLYMYGLGMFQKEFRAAINHPEAKVLWVNEAYQYRIST